MPLVLFQPIGEVLYIHRLVFRLYRLFDGNDVHADAAASRRNHSRDFFERQERHALEEHRKLGVSVHKRGVHVRVFGRARHEQRHPIPAVGASKTRSLNRTVFGVLVAVVVFQHAQNRQLVDNLVKLGIRFRSNRRALFHFFQRVFLPQLHLEKKVERDVAFLLCQLVLEYARKAPILGVLGLYAVQLRRQPVRDFSDKLQKPRVGIFVVYMLRHIFRAHFRHGYIPLDGFF